MKHRKGEVDYHIRGLIETANVSTDQSDRKQVPDEKPKRSDGRDLLNGTPELAYLFASNGPDHPPKGACAA